MSPSMLENNYFNPKKTETEKQALLIKYESTSKFVRQKRDEIQNLPQDKNKFQLLINPLNKPI